MRALTVEQLDAIRRIDSPTIANAIEHFGVRGRVEGFAGWVLRCAFPALGTLLGYAVTCTADIVLPETPRRRDTTPKSKSARTDPISTAIFAGDNLSRRLHCRSRLSAS